MAELLKHKKSRRVLLALDILETCSKNGKQMFHKRICTASFMKALVSQLKKVKAVRM